MNPADAMPVLGWVDWTLLAVLALSVVVGLWRGLVFELMSLVGWVVAYVAAQLYSPLVAAHLPVGLPGSALNLGAGFALSFFGVLIAWTLLARLVRLLVHATTAPSARPSAWCAAVCCCWPWPRWWPSPRQHAANPGRIARAPPGCGWRCRASSRCFQPMSRAICPSDPIPPQHFRRPFAAPSAFHLSQPQDSPPCAASSASSPKPQSTS